MQPSLGRKVMPMAVKVEAKQGGWLLLNIHTPTSTALFKFQRCSFCHWNGARDTTGAECRETAFSTLVWFLVLYAHLLSS